MLATSKRAKTTALESLKFDHLTPAKRRMVPLRYASHRHTHAKSL